MSEAQAPFAIPTAATPSADEDATTSLYRAAIGPVSTAYYLPIFSRFEAAERAGLSWNTAASLLTFNWLIYRQLWGAALAYAGILAAVGLLVFGIGRLVFQMSDTLTMALSLGLGLAAFVLPGLFGNVLFHKDCRKRMAAALADHAVLADACVDLQRKSSSRLRALWVAMANLAVLGVAAFAYLQISALSTLTVMPHGALDAGHIETGLGANAAGPMAGVSAPAAPAPAASAAADAASAAPAPLPSASQASAAAAPQTAASASALAPTVVASAPVASLATPEPIEVTLPSPPPPDKARPAPTAEPKAKTNAKASTEEQPASRKKTAPPSVAKNPPVSAPTAAPEVLFYINVGLFSKPQNAARVHAQLLEAKLPSVMKDLKTAKDRQIRVRVGPFATEVQAEAAAEKIRAMKFDAGIIQQ